jgi:diguanylate cyclase (GGDEF)-like protein/PAS domain S-box-containing protein
MEKQFEQEKSIELQLEAITSYGFGAAARNEPIILPMIDFEALFEHNPLPLVLYNLHSTKIHAVNLAAEKTLLCSRSDIIGEEICTLFEPSRRAETLSFIRSLSEGAAYKSRRWDVLRKDGLKFVAEVTSSPVVLDGKPYRIAALIDLSYRIAIEEAARLAERKFRNIFENAGEGIFQTTVDGRYLAANPALAKIYGYSSPAELIEKLTDIKHQLYVDPVKRESFLKLINDHKYVQDFEAQVYRQDGSIIWISENSRPVYDEHGVLQYYEGLVVDVTERKQFEQTIQWQAFHDSLTGLPNRLLFQDRLDQALASAEKRGHSGAVLFLDLDNFKSINDTLGHSTGDQLLQHVAVRLRVCLRPGDTLARMGGDEFTVLLPDVPSSELASAVANRMLEALSSPVKINGCEIFPTASIGIAIFPRDGAEPTTLLKHADTAMYCVKEGGRGHYQEFSAEMNESAYERLVLSNHLRNAIEFDQLSIHYQPKVDLQTDDIVGVEALLRWSLPNHGSISPTKFIPIAEESGLIIPLGDWVIRNACIESKVWIDEGYKLKVAVNLSARQFRQPNLIGAIEQVLDELSFPAECLNIELTESAIIENGVAAVDLLTDLKRLGVTVSLDDFGTGYSSLSYLRKFPVDAVKIDRSFISNIDRDPKDQAVVRAIIDLAHALDLYVTAEGVETETQKAILQDLGCNLMQGFLFSKPLPFEEFDSLLRRLYKHNTSKKVA